MVSGIGLLVDELMHLLERCSKVLGNIGVCKACGTYPNPVRRLTMVQMSRRVVDVVETIFAYCRCHPGNSNGRDDGRNNNGSGCNGQGGLW